MYMSGIGYVVDVLQICVHISAIWYLKNVSDILLH